MAADPRILQAILREARRRRLPKDGRVVKSAVETGLAESGLQNLPGGDADSAGWRQERRSLYPNPTNVQASVRRYFDEAQQLNTGRGSAGALAAAVQRPAAQYRGRYQDASQAAAHILEHLAGTGSVSGGGAFTPARVQLGTQTAFDQAGYDAAKRASIVGSLIAKRRGTNNILFRSGVLSTAAPDPVQFQRQQLTSKLIPGRSAAAAQLPAQASGGAIATFEGKQVAAWMVPALRYARQNGWKGTISSGVRTRAEQAALYANRASNPNPVAKPGQSNHEVENGGAVDVTDPATLAQIMARYRGRRLVQGTAIGDPVHFSASGR